MKKSRLIGICFAVFLVLFSGCQNEKSTDAGHASFTPPSVGTAAVFRGEKLNLPDEPEGLMLDTLVDPFSDEEGIVCLVSVLHEEAEEDGDLRRYYAYYRVALSQDGESADVSPLELPENVSVAGGRMTKDGCTLLLFTDSGEFTVLRRTPDGDKTSGNLLALLPPGGEDVNLTGLSEDASGNLWIAAGHAVLALDPSFSLRFAAQFDGPAWDIEATDDGGAWVLAMEGEMTVCRVNPSGYLTDRIAAGQTANALVLRDDSLYCDTESGIVKLSPDGNEPVVDYAASNLSSATSRLLTVLDENRILLAKNGTDGFDLFLYARSDGSEDIEVRTLEAVVALPEGADSGESQYWRIMAAEFNSSHRDLQIHLTDYAETWREGSGDALARDLLTGTVKPDILLGNPWLAYEDVVVGNGMFYDLTPYLETDPEVNFDTLLGGAVRACSYGDQVWGIPTGFRVVTVIAPDSLLGPFAGASGWTVTDMLDCIDALPEDVTPFLGISQDFALEFLLGDNGLAGFLDRKAGTCSFDGPEFLRLLNYISTLPVDDEDALRSSSVYAAYRDAVMNGDGSGKLEPYHTGKVFMRTMQMNRLSDYLGLEMQFGTKDVTLIGYPTDTPDIPGAGTFVIPELPMVILNTCEDPDAAWSFIKAMLGGSRPHLNPYNPPLKSTLQKVVQGSTQVHFFYDGGSYTGQLPSSYEKRKHITVTVEKEDEDAYIRLLDQIGAPYLGAVPAEITAIVSEEVSAMTAGVSTPEACAAIIQSRASIWMAEHQ